MAKHLQSCERRGLVAEPKTKKAEPSKRKLFHILVEGCVANMFFPEYWLHIEAPADATLKKLDTFLRDIWLTCCSHMSAFTIGERRYSILPMEELKEQGMEIALNELLRPKAVFFYEYDFGSTTALRLKVVSERWVNRNAGKAIKALARNEAPLLKCEVCGDFATDVCSNCIYDGKGWRCDEHIEDHECGEEMFLPIMNSPRVGTCAYGAI